MVFSVVKKIPFYLKFINDEKKLIKIIVDIFWIFDILLFVIDIDNRYQWFRFSFALC